MGVKVQVRKASVLEITAGAVVVNLFQGVDSPGGATGAVDAALGGAIREAIASGEFKGKAEEVLLLHTLGKIPAKRVVVVGLGKREEFDGERARRAAAAAARAAQKAGASVLATIAHGAGAGGLDPAAAGRATVEGTILGLYRYREFKSAEEDKDPEVEELVICESDPGKLPALEMGARIGAVVGQATNYARDLTNRPANSLTPSMLAEVASQMARDAGLECDIMAEDQLKTLGMEGILGVARGSDSPPRLITLRYRGKPGEDNWLAFVGKGLTFDSGGISIKPSENMHEMKGDMAGGAAVIAAMNAISQLKPAINVLGIVPATENMPSGKALKPGDVLKIGGKTVEVVNTDAEGRLVLADGIRYARSQGAVKLVDIATLTGACIIALGHVATGLVGNERGIIEEVKAAAEEAGEKVWELPAYREYKELLKSDVADIKNVGGRAAGVITGAMFIGEFAGDTPWAHLDIAGTSWLEKDGGYNSKGATGAGVRTLVTLAMRLSGQS